MWWVKLAQCFATASVWTRKSTSHSRPESPDLSVGTSWAVSYRTQFSWSPATPNNVRVRSKQSLINSIFDAVLQKCFKPNYRVQVRLITTISVTKNRTRHEHSEGPLCFVGVLIRVLTDKFEWVSPKAIEHGTGQSWGGLVRLGLLKKLGDSGV